MQKIYLQLIDQAVADNVITPEQYLQIPWDERGSMRYLFFPDGRQAVAEGIITLKQYLEIPSDERESMEYLFSRDGRQSVAEGIITLKQYLRIPCEERKNIQSLFSRDGRQALADGIITIERYLQIPSRERKDAMTVLQNPNTRRIPCDVRQALVDGIITIERYLQMSSYERNSMKCLFSSDGRQAVADGVITLEQYLQIPWYERDGIKPLFSRDGRQSLADGIITLEKYLRIPTAERKMDLAVNNSIMKLDRFLQIPWHERGSMRYLFSLDGRQAVTDGLITLEQYLQIPWHERESMEYLFSSGGRQAVADGLITLERYLQMPSYERNNIQSLFSLDGRQALADGIITLEKYLRIPIAERKMDLAVDNSIMKLDRFLQIPWHERGSMRYLFSLDGRQSLADGIITIERYLQIPCEERKDMEYFFSSAGRQAIADHLITFEQYRKIPWHKCRKLIIALQDLDIQQGIRSGQITIENMPLISQELRDQAIAAGIITLEQYRQIPWSERDSMEDLFSPNGRQAVADGIMTLERYLQIPLNARRSMEYLFSPDGRQAIAAGIITLEQYLQIPWYERQNAMTALRDLDTRQRIINGEITIEEIIGTSPVAVPNINGAQSTHTASVHESVSESATRLATLYQSRIDGAGLENTIEKAQAYINSLPDDSEKNRAAKECFSRIAAPDYTFADPRSQVSIRQLLALTFLAMHDDEKRVGSLEDAQMQFVEGLYEIQRGYNLSESGIDQGGKDRYICSTGTFSKLIEKLQGISLDCVVLYITEETASLKLPIVVREEAMRYLETFVKPNTAEVLRTFTNLITHVKKEGVEVIWEHIKEPIAMRMFDEFSRLYRDRTNPDFIALVKAGKDGELGDLSTFQEQVQKDYLIKHRLDGSEAQKEDIISPEEIFLVEVDKDVELDDLNTFQEQVQNDYLNEHRYNGSETHKEEIEVIDLQKLIYAKSILLQLKTLENKAKNLRDRNHILAYCKAANIVQLLRCLNQDYFTKEKIDYKTYKEKSLAIINQERPELDKHRGYKQILGNLLILICTLGAVQLINKACTGNFLFFKKTDSSKLIDNVSHMIEKMEFELRI